MLNVEELSFCELIQYEELIGKTSRDFCVNCTIGDTAGDGGGKRVVPMSRKIGKIQTLLAEAKIQGIEIEKKRKWAKRKKERDQERQQELENQKKIEKIEKDL